MIYSKFKYKNICAGLLGLSLLFTSCKDQLATNPLDQFANEAFWKSENDAFLAVTGLYRGEIQMNQGAEFSPSDWWSYYGLLYLEFASDNAYDRRGDNADLNKLSDGTLTSSVGVLTNYWRNSYKRIAKTNFFLENVHKVPVDEKTMARYTAEARFLRAAQYYYLSQHFGSAPLVTKVLTLPEANSVDKATKAELVAFVNKEFTEIVNDLPSFGELPAQERGRITKQGVLAFLGRLQLSEKNFSGAAKTYETIVSANENAIDPNYASLFDGTNESSSEIVFATQYLADLAANAMLQNQYPASAGGWHLHNPLGSLVESYQFTDGTSFKYEDSRYNPLNLTKDRDPRFAYTVVTNGDTFKDFKYQSHPDLTASADQLTTTKQATRTGYSLRKFNNEKFSGDLQNSGIDVPIIRYSEILLSYLESKLENGDAIDQALLDATINKVRTRQSVNMPAITETSPAKLRPILRNERRVELALEGIRYWDLLRWDVAHEVLKGDFYGAPFPTANNVRVNPKGVKDVHSRWYVTSKNFRQGQDRYWPVPQSEVNVNPNLK